MNLQFGDYLISDDKSLIQINQVHDLISKTYWASNRSKDIIEKSIVNSLCFGVYINTVQIGFARCVTDYATTYWLCDVVIDSKYRGHGLGKALMKSIIEHEDLKLLVGILGTKDAHGLYEKYGFKRHELMRKPPDFNIEMDIIIG